MEIAANKPTHLVSGSDFARMRLLKGADIANIEDLLEECPVISLDEQQTLSESLITDYSLFVLLSGRLELSGDAGSLPAVVTAGDYVGGLNPGLMASNMSTYRAMQRSQLLAFNEDMLRSLMMVSHSAAVNLSVLAMDQLKHLPAANDSGTAQPVVATEAAPVATDALPAPKLHDAKWLEELLDRQIIRSLTDQEPLSLAVLEIDNTAAYMEKHGEASLDYVSNSVAHNILDNVRPGDLVARIDAEHFVIVLPKASIEDARLPAERLSKMVAKTEIVIPNDCTLPPVTISAGITQLKAMVGAEKFVTEGIDALGRANESGPGSISD